MQKKALEGSKKETVIRPDKSRRIFSPVVARFLPTTRLLFAIVAFLILAGALFYGGYMLAVYDEPEKKVRDTDEGDTSYRRPYREDVVPLYVLDEDNEYDLASRDGVIYLVKGDDEWEMFSVPDGLPTSSFLPTKKSPDGNKYMGQFRYGSTNEALYVIDVSKKQGAIIETYVPTYGGGKLGSWSRDSQRIAYSIVDEKDMVTAEPAEVSVYSLDTQEKKNLFTSSHANGEPLDVRFIGESVVFGDGNGVYKIDPETVVTQRIELPLVPLTQPNGTYEGVPSGYLAQAKEDEREFFFVTEAGDIYQMNADSFSHRRVVSVPGATIYYLAFSPDREKVALLVDSEVQESGLRLVAVSSGVSQTLADPEYDASAIINWSPDSRYFQTYTSIYDASNGSKLPVAIGPCGGGGWASAKNVIWPKEGAVIAYNICGSSRPGEEYEGWRLYDLATNRDIVTIPAEWEVTESINANSWRLYQKKYGYKDGKHRIVSERTATVDRTGTITEN